MSLLLWFPFHKDTKNQGVVRTDLVSVGSPILQNDPKWGKSASVGKNDGTLTNYYQTALSSNMIFPKAGGSFTLSCFARFHTNRNYCGIMGNNNYQTSGIGLGLITTVRGIFMASGQVEEAVTFNVPVLNTWYHYTLTYDSGTRLASAYVDGQLVSSKTIAFDWAMPTIPFQIGRVPQGGWTQTNEMDLADVRIYDHCLGADEARELSWGLNLHYNFEDPYVEGTTNLVGAFTNNNFTPANYNARTSCSWLKDSIPFLRFIPAFTEAIDTAFRVTSKEFAVAAGKNITCSWLYRSNATTLDKFQHTTSGWSTNIRWSDGTRAVLSTANTLIERDCKWHRVSFTIAVPSGITSASLQIGVDSPNFIGLTSEYLDIAQVQVEEKDYATPYTSGTRSTPAILDASGHGRNGTVRGRAVTSVDSGYGYKAGFLDPIWDRDDANRVMDDDHLSYIYAPIDCLKEKWSIAFWYNGQAKGFQGGGYISASDSMLLSAYNTVGFNSRDNSVDINRIGESSVRVTGINWDGQQGTWTYEVYTYDSMNFKFYRNGVLYKSLSWETENYLVPPSYIGIGFSYAGGVKRNMRAYIGDFKVYGNVLSAEDVEWTYKVKGRVSKQQLMAAPYFKAEGEEIGEPLREALKKRQWINGIYRYWQTNCTSELTASGFQVVRKASANNYGGLVIRSEHYLAEHYKPGHTYYISMEAEGHSNDGMASPTIWPKGFAGWGSGSNVGVANKAVILRQTRIPAGFNGKMLVEFAFRIPDDDTVYKVPPNAYGPIKEADVGQPYLSYGDIVYNWGYTTDHEADTDITFSNITFMDITDSITNLSKTGVWHTPNMNNFSFDQAQIGQFDGLRANEFEEV